MVACGHVDGDGVVAQTKLVHHGGCGTALPDLNMNVGAIDGLQKLRVGAIGKVWMDFDQGSDELAISALMSVANPVPIDPALCDRNF